MRPYSHLKRYKWKLLSLSLHWKYRSYDRVSIPTYFPSTLWYISLNCTVDLKEVFPPRLWGLRSVSWFLFLFNFISLLVKKEKLNTWKQHFFQTTTCIQMIMKFSFIRSQTIRKEICCIQSKCYNIFLVHPGMNYFILVMLVRKIARTTMSFVMSICLHPSVHLSAWNNSVPTGRVFMKFGIWVFFEKP